MGVDPATNICKIANKRKIKTLNSFFNSKITQKILKNFGKAKVITGSNVFAHIDNLDLFFKNIKKLLENQGVLIIEVPYFLNLIKNLEYDTIYHEHLSYITLIPLNKYLRKIGMQIFDVEEKDIKLVEIIPIEFITRNVATGSITKRLGIEDGTVLKEPLIEYCFNKYKEKG